MERNAKTSYRILKRLSDEERDRVLKEFMRLQELSLSVAKEDSLLPEAHPGTSAYIDKLSRYLESLGVSVTIYANLVGTGASGRTDYKRKTIRIDEPNASLALITLAHEGGHWIHYLRNPNLEQNRTPQFRERMAYLYGWGLLVKIGVVKNKVVDKPLYKKYGIAPEFREGWHAIA
jgi:hypothetical protein